MRLLITGLTGRLGRHLYMSLNASGHIVAAVVRNHLPTSMVNKNKITQIFYNSSEFEKKVRDFNPDIVLHMACDYGHSSNFQSMFDANYNIGDKILKAVKPLHNSVKFINISTALPSNYNLYSHLKHEFNQRLNSEFISSQTLKIHNIYGPSQNGNDFVSSLLGAIVNKSDSFIIKFPSLERDFIYVEDVVNIINWFINNNIDYNRYIEFEVGTGKSTKILDFAQMLKSVFKSDIQLICDEHPENINLSHSMKADNKLLKKTIPDLRFNDLRQGIIKLYKSYSLDNVVYD